MDWSTLSRRRLIRRSRPPVGEAQGLRPSNLLQRALADPKKLAPNDVMQLQSTFGNQAALRLLGRGDKSAAEGEAEAVATRITGGGALQRSAAADAGSSLVTPEIERSIDSQRGRGKALPPPLQSRMEGALGVNLSDVRLHTDRTAGQISRSLEARAFTSGRDIFFKEGEYDPNSSAGQRLIAHELTHVVQQSGGAPEIQRMTDEELQTKIGKVKYKKLVRAGKLPYFLSLGEGKIRTYMLMPHGDFDRVLKTLPSKPKKQRGSGGTVPKTSSTPSKVRSPKSEPPQTTTTESPQPQEPQVEPDQPQEPEVDPEVEKQKVREQLAADLEKSLEPLLASFDTLDVNKEDEVNSLLDNLMTGPVATLLDKDMLRRSENLKKILDKLYALLVTAWTHNKTGIITRVKGIFTDMHVKVPDIGDLAGDKDLEEKLTQGKGLVQDRMTFMQEQRTAAKDVSNPSLKVNRTLTIPGYKVLQWYEEATETQLRQFYDPSSKPAQDITKWKKVQSFNKGGRGGYGKRGGKISYKRELDKVTTTKGTWLDDWARLKWKDEYVKNNYRDKYGRQDWSTKQYGLLGSVKAGRYTFNVEDKLWVKKGTSQATRYYKLGEDLNKDKTPEERARALRKIVSGDFTGVDELEVEAALAMFGAETARNPRSYGVGLMLLDMIENEATYGSNKKYNFAKLLGSSPHDDEDSVDFKNRKTRATRAKQTRWGYMKGAIDTYAPQFKNYNFEALWAGKWSMSPSASMTLGALPIPSNTSQLNTVQYKELKTILNWYINFMRGAQLNVKDETDAKNALIRLFKERLGKTDKMGAGSFSAFFA